MARITVVDDVAVNRELLVAMLGSFGHRISEAADGASALELVREEQPDLIICDILMPQMDGYEFVRRLRADPQIAATPVIFCSAHFLEPEAQQLARLCGVSKVLTKPFDPQDMIDDVHSILAQSGAGSASQSPLRGNEFDREHLRLVTDKLLQKVAELKDYAHELEAEIDEHKRTRGHLAALYGVANVLNVASSVEDVTEKLLKVACLELGFSAAILWRAEETDGTLQCMDVWCRSAERCAGVIKEVRSLSLTSDRDLALDALPTDIPLWFADLRSSPDARRRQAAERLGVSSGGAVAILASSRVAGILEVFLPEPSELDGALAATLVALAGQIGAFFERIAQQQRIVRLTRLYAVLSSINSAIVRIHESHQLFQEACRVAVHEGGFAMAWIGEVGSRGEAVVPLAWQGVGDGSGPDGPALSGDGVLGADAARQAMHDSELVVVNAPDDPESNRDPDPLGRRARALPRRGYRSLVALPLTVQAKVVDVMVIYANEPDFFTGEERKLLNELANDLSFALEFITNQDRLAYLAHHDELTGLPNRAHLLEYLCAALQAARHHPGDRVGVVVWDISRFRNINDSFGRQIGDKVLRELARRLAVAWPNASEVARIGVDQFAAVINGDYELTEIARLIEDTARRILNEPVVVGEHALHITVSAGIALGNGRDDLADGLISNAEAALRRAKGSGLNYRFYGPEMNALIAETLLLENRLRQAIERDEFVLHYQPKICCISGQVTGLEALLRWNDPTDGLVYPDTLIPILEDTGMIIQVGLWAIRQALAEIRIWQAAGLDALRVAVNVSALQLQHPGFVDSLRRVTDEFGDIAGRLDLEITESMIMTDIEANVSRLAEVRRMGIEIAIDDFGTGYSSLGYLARLPVNALKIDHSFVATMGTTPESLTISTTIISLAHALGLKVIAEGVEDENQASALRRLKCNELQGYLFSRPLPPEQVVDFVRARLGHESMA